MQLFIYLFICLFIYLFIQSFIHLFMVHFIIVSVFHTIVCQLTGVLVKDNLDNGKDLVVSELWYYLPCVKRDQEKWQNSQWG
jgi:hypothetical protein